MAFLVVYCTVPDQNIGRLIAKTLVEEALCACVNQIPSVTSYYIYEGQFNEDSEELLIIKTDEQHFETLKERIESLHPYAVPEIIASSIEKGNSAYLEWLRESLR